MSKVRIAIRKKSSAGYTALERMKQRFPGKKITFLNTIGIFLNYIVQGYSPTCKFYSRNLTHFNMFYKQTA